MKYRFRVLIALGVFFFFKLTSTPSHSFFEWDTISTVSLIYLVVVVLILWEILARIITYLESKESISNISVLYKISAKAALIGLFFVFLFSYLYNEVLFDCCLPKMSAPNLWDDTAQGFLIALLIIAYEIIRIYLKYAIQEAKEKEQIQKELISAQFEGLKNQVNPHFLFNSFSVLTSLVETDNKKAVEFIAKLSDMYRYILENDNIELVPIKSELGFLDDYLFLLEMRNPDAIRVEKDFDNLDESIQIPPMSLQLLIENAVKHNSFSVDDPLIITIQNKGGDMIIVENAKNLKKALSKSTGIGLKNLSKRLVLSFGRSLEIVEDQQIFRVGLPISA